MHRIYNLGGKVSWKTYTWKIKKEIGGYHCERYKGEKMRGREKNESGSGACPKWALVLAFFNLLLLRLHC